MFPKDETADGKLKKKTGKRIGEKRKSALEPGILYKGTMT